MYKQTTVTLLSDLLSGLKNTDSESTTTQGLSQSDNLWQAIGLVILLVVILVAAYYTSKFVGGIKLGQMKNSNFKVIDSFRISPNKILHIVKIGTRYVVLAVNKDSVNFIMEMDEAELQLNDKNPELKQSFKQIFDKIGNKKE